MAAAGDRWAAALAGLHRAGSAGLDSARADSARADSARADSARADSARADRAGPAGLDVEVGAAEQGTEPVVVRDGAALLVRAGDVVVRVRSEAAGGAVAQREVGVARLLSANGVPVTGLVGDHQPWSIGGFAVTSWRWTEAVGAADAGQLSSLARTLRDRTARAEGLATSVAFDPLEAILGAVAHLPASDPEAAFIRSRAAALATGWADATTDDPLGRSIVHGDLHAGNVVVGAGGPLLTDLELAGSGPPSYDAAPAVVAEERFGAPAGSAEAFLDGFGSDPRSWSGFATFVALYELWGTAWAVGVRHLDQAWAVEATRRVESLRDGADHRWRLS